jgi:Zn-dependent protease/CBS domain-containing protein
MGWSLRLFSVKGIELRVHATFVLILIWAAFYWGGRDEAGWQGALFGVVATLLLFICVVLHELGHSFQAREYGINVRDITLLPIGGVASLEDIPDSPYQELRIAIAGPLVNVAIAVVLIGISAVLSVTTPFSTSDFTDDMQSGEWSGLLPYLTAANIVLFLFNILPAFPMDGGRILRSILAMRLGYRHATEIAVNIGKGMAILFGIAGVASGDFFLLFIAVFVWFGASIEGRQSGLRSVLRRVNVGDVMSRQPQFLTVSDPIARGVELTLSTFQADFPVVDGDNRVVGLVMADDLLKAVRDRPDALVGSIMRRKIPRATMASPLVDVQQRMAESGLLALPVVDNDGRLVGLLTAADVGEAYRLFSRLPEVATAEGTARPAR